MALKSFFHFHIWLIEMCVYLLFMFVRDTLHDVLSLKTEMFLTHVKFTTERLSSSFYLFAFKFRSLISHFPFFPFYYCHGAPRLHNLHGSLETSHFVVMLEIPDRETPETHSGSLVVRDLGNWGYEVSGIELMDSCLQNPCSTTYSSLGLPCIILEEQIMGVLSVYLST